MREIRERLHIGPDADCKTRQKQAAGYTDSLFQKTFDPYPSIYLNSKLCMGHPHRCASPWLARGGLF
jgi:hypothetical protein